MDKRASAPGRTQSFVQATGFREIGGRMLLIDSNGEARAFLEVTGDPDRRGQEPAAVYARLLAGMRPGTILRVLQIYWPDELPRTTFLDGTGNWRAGKQGRLGELHSNFRRFLKQAPLPFHRRTIFEIVIKIETDLDWVSGAADLLAGGGLEAAWLDPEAVLDLLSHLFHPSLP